MSKGIKSKKKESFSIATKYEAFYTGGHVQFTSDGERMLCTCGEHLKVLDVKSGKIEQSIHGEDAEISSFILAEDDSTLIVAAKNGILKQWNLTESNLIRTWKSFHIGRVSCMAFDNSITLLATGGSDSTVKVWDIHKKYCTHNLKGAEGVFSVVCFQCINSKLYIFGAADDYKIHVWDLDNSRCVSVLSSHCSTVTGLAFIEEKQNMISCGRDKVIIIWDFDSCVSSGKPIKIIPVFEAIESIILAPEVMIHSLVSDHNEENTYVVTAGEKGILRIWECSTAKCVYNQENSLVAPPQDSDYDGLVIIQANYIPSAEAICVVTFEQNIILYNLKDLSLLKQFVGYNDDILDVKLMGKEEEFLAVATNSPHIKIFELNTFNCQLLKGHLDIVIALDVFPHDPYMLLSGSKDNSVKIWKMDPENGTIDCVFLGYGHTHSVGAVACCKGKSLFFLSGSEDTTLKLWDVPAKIPLIALKFTLSSRCTVKAHEKNINSITVSLNDKLIATGSQDCTAKIWDAADLSLVGTMRGHRKGVWCVTFSPVDLVLATSSGDGTIKIWSLSDFSTLKTFDGHDSSVLKVQFLTRGIQLISSASDGLLKLWEIKENECVKTFDGHDNKIWALCVSSDESFIISGAADSNLIVWKDVTKEEREQVLAKQEEFLLQEQGLSNLIHKKKWCKALGLAIRLEQPSRTLNIMNEILLEKDGKNLLEETLQKLSPDQKDVLWKFSIEWNTNSKHYLPAQLVLKTILKSYSTEELLKIPDKRSSVEALLPYTERHFNRVNRMLQDAQILQFIWQNMRVTGEPQTENDHGS